MSSRPEPLTPATTRSAQVDHARAVAQNNLDQQGLMDLLGAVLGQVEPGRACIVLPVRNAVTQQDGFVHAGAVSAIADNAGGCAALTVASEGTQVLGVTLAMAFLAPAAGDHLEAVGTVIRAGRTIVTCDLAVFAHREGSRTLVATGLQTLMTRSAHHGDAHTPSLTHGDHHA